MSKRALLAGLCDRVGATGLMLERRRNAVARWLPVLTFHRVASVVDNYMFDEGVIDTTPHQFEEQLLLVRRYFTPVGVDEVVSFVSGGSLPANPILVTFDDGYQDNRNAALPILLKLGIRAVFFIATDYVTRRRVFWWDRLSYLVKSSPCSTIAIRYPEPRTFALVTQDDRNHAMRALLRFVKCTPYLDLERFLTELARAAHVAWTEDHERRFANELLMTWDQIRELRAAGMDVQSHTRTHRVLQTLTPEQVVEELVGSRLDLERELGERVSALSYPVGHTINDRADVRVAMKEAGYQIGFTNATGAQPLTGKLDRYNVNRIGIDLDTPRSLFKAILAMPQLF